MNLDKLLSAMRSQQTVEATPLHIGDESVIVSTGLVIRGVYDAQLPNVPTICLKLYGERQEEVLRHISAIDPDYVHCNFTETGALQLCVQTDPHPATMITIDSKYIGVANSDVWALQLAYQTGSVLFVRTLHITAIDGSILADSKLRRVSAINSFLLQHNSTVH